MRSIKTFGLAIVAVVAFSAISVASASALTEFEASATGGTLSGKAKTTQKFKTGGGATVECKEAVPNGTVTKLKGTEQESSVAYSSCSVLSIGTASVSLADYTFFIPSEVSILTASITIHAEGFGLKCTILVDPGQTLGSGSKEIEYENNSAKTGIIVKSKVTKIVSHVTESNSESLCGKEGEVKEGTYEGNVETLLSNGTIQVK